MAKSTQPTSGVLALLDAAERRIFEASRGGSLAAATQAQLGKLVGQARALRDKWREQFRGQRRTSQRTAGARGVGGNDRSREKSEIFTDVVTRIEARLAELGTSVAKAVSAAAGGTGPSKAARARSHRATRASTRAALAEFVSPSGGRARAAGTAKPVAERTVAASGGSTAVTKQAAKSATAKSSVAAKPLAGVAKAVEAPALTKRTAAVSKKRRTGKPATVAASKATSKHKSQVISALPATQVRAAAKLKASRVRLAGLDTRLRGHTMAQGRRRQGRKDGRGT